MIIDLPFTYDLQFTPPRHRQVHTAKILDRLPLKVRTGDDADFPVAFRYLSARDVPFSFDERPLPPPADIRWDGRRLYSRDSKDAPPLDDAGVQELVANRGRTPFSAVQGFSDRHAPRPRDRAEIEGRIYTDDRRERVAEILEFARGVVFCDGYFWKPITEPVWKLDRDRQFPCIEATLSSDHDLEQYPQSLFRADRAKEALAAAAFDTFARPHGQTVKQKGIIEVLVPEAVTLPLDDMALLKQAEEALSHYDRDLPKATVEFFVAYAALRDALAATDARTVTDEVVNGVRGFLGVLPETDKWDGENWKRAVLALNLDRWRNEVLRDLDLATIDGTPGRQALPPQGR